MKTSDLIGLALDWAVETLEIARMRADGEYVKEWWVEQKQCDPSPYTTDWLRAGPIIEREKLTLEWTSAGQWRACSEWMDKPMYEGFGPTPLTAAMRCYVSSKLGGEVEIPKELK